MRMSAAVNSSIFLQLPNDLFPLAIQPYLTAKDYYFFITSTKKWQETKFATIQVMLRSGFLSASIKKPTHFIHRLINQKKQIRYICASESQESIERMGWIVDDCFKFRIFEVDHIFVNWMKSADIEHLILKRIKQKEDYLIFEQFSGRISIINPLIDELVDFSRWKNLYEFKASCLNIPYVQCLKYFHKVSLMKCDNILDIHELGDVYELTLINCSGIEDISGLMNNKILTIFDCLEIDLNTIHFTNVQRLHTDLFLFDFPTHDILGFKEVTDLSLKIKNHSKLRSNFIHYFSEKKLQRFKITSPGNEFIFPFPEQVLQTIINLYHLRLDNCFIPELSILRKIPFLSFISCRFFNITGNSENHVVEIISCSELTNFTFFNGIPKLLISYSFLWDVSQVSHVNHLILKDCQEIEDISLLVGTKNQVDQLEIINCQNILHFRGLEQIRSIKYVYDSDRLPSGLQCSELRGMKSDKLEFIGRDVKMSQIFNTLRVISSYQLVFQEENRLVYLRRREGSSSTSLSSSRTNCILS